MGKERGGVMGVLVLVSSDFTLPMANFAIL
jgi:hypothetical protein